MFICIILEDVFIFGWWAIDACKYLSYLNLSVFSRLSV